LSASPHAGRLLLLHITALRVMTWARMALLPYSFSRSRLEKAMAQKPGSMDAQALKPLLQAYRRSCRLHIPPPNCLRDMLTLHHLLARSGVASRLHIGVRKVGQQVDAHAWLETTAGCIGTESDDLAPFIPLERP
jgi:hypothetical protein